MATWIAHLRIADLDFKACRREYIDLSQAEMAAFVDETADYLERAYAALAGKLFIPDSAQTILDLFRDLFRE